MAIATPAPVAHEESFWLAHFTRTIFFFAAVLTVAGIYLAFQVPISVFPETNFPARRHRRRQRRDAGRADGSHHHRAD